MAIVITTIRIIPITSGRVSFFNKGYKTKLAVYRERDVQYELFEHTQSGLIALEEVFRAYYDCRRNKRRMVNAISFELDFERELVRLW